MDTILDVDAGVQQFFKGLARYLIGRGQEVRIMVPGVSVDDEFKGNVLSLGQSFDPVFNTTTIPLALHAKKSRVKSILNSEHFDIIHTALPLSPLSGAKVLRYAKCPVVGSYMVYLKGGVHNNIMRVLEFFSRSNKYVDYFIAPSEAARVDAEKLIPGDYNIIPHSVDSKRFSPDVRPLEKFTDGKLNVLFLGRLEKRKGCEYLIRAFSGVKKKIDHVKLIIAGDGPLRKSLEEMSENLGIDDDVIFEGYVDESIKPRYYASADLCVFPAIYGECFGIVLIEALSSGKIPIVFDNVGYQWVLRNIKDLVVKCEDVDGLTDKIVKILENSDLRKDYEKKCFEESRQYTWNSVGWQIEEVYEKLLKM